MRSAHVTVIGREHDHRVVPRTAALQGAEHAAEAVVGELVELHVVVELPPPRRVVLGRQVARQPVLLVPAPLAMTRRLGEQVVAEVLGEAVDDLRVVVRERRHRVAVLPLGRVQQGLRRGELVGVGRLVVGLVHREPHHVVGVHEGDRQEPRIGLRPVGFQPASGGVRDHRVEVDAGAGPAHEVLVVAVPVGVAVEVHRRLGAAGEVPLADVRGAIATRSELRAQRGDGGIEALVPLEDGVVVHLVAGEVAARHHRGAGRGARRRVRPVVGQLHALGHQALAPGKPHRRGEPGALALLVRDHEQHVGSTTGHGRSLA